jgi:hypothetical protein
MDLRRSGQPIVLLRGDHYAVTFPTVLPPGVRGADYVAKVTLHGRTGEILDVLVGS